MKSLGEKLKDWRRLFEGVKAHPEAVALLGEEHAALGRHIQEIDGLIYQEGKHEAGLREATRRRREVERLLTELHGRIVFVLRGRYGKRNPLLQGFGVEPHAPRGSRQRDREEPEEGGSDAAG